jgi:transposase
MSEITTIGLDLAKHVFQVHGIDAQGTTVLRKRLRRGQVLAFFSRIPRCVVGLGGTTPLTESRWVAAFVQRLHELGWIKGRTVAVEYRWAEGRDERFVEMAAEFVQRKVDVIVTSSTVGSGNECCRADPVIIGQGLYTS